MRSGPGGLRVTLLPRCNRATGDAPAVAFETGPTKVINYALFQVFYRIIRSNKDTAMAARIVG